MADVMTVFRDQSLATKFLSEEDIKQRCPVAFLTEGTNNVSDNYVVARTIDVVRDLAKLGWYPVEAKQRKPQKNSSGRFNYHVIFFQNPDIKIVKTIKDSEGNSEEVVDCFPRIMLSNSMDGTCCFRFMVGIFRLVCSNGLVIASDMFANMKIRHIYYTFEDLQKLIIKATEELPNQVGIMNTMQSTILTQEQQLDLALKMYRIRQGKDSNDDTVLLDEDAIQDLLTPVRQEDEGNDLWLCFNRVQERLIKGLYSTTAKPGKVRKARPVKGFIRDIAINEKFWKLARTYAVS